MKGDFSFRHKWDYPEGVYRNQYGQLSCYGNCPDGVDSMLDHKGKIKKGFYTAFYRLVDTSRLYHSISSNAWCYEWSGTDYVEFEKNSGDTIILKTALNAGTHCSLRLYIIGDYCYSIIDLNSIVAGGSAIYYCTEGSISIDKTLWMRGIMKAVFSFKFKHDEDPKQPMYWKGKIYSQFKDGSTNR